MQPTVDSIIDEMEQYKPVLYASNWQRFANLIIDALFYYLLLLLIMVLVVVISQLFQTDMIGLFVSEEPIDILFSGLINTVILFVMYLLFEGITKGRTLGKLITGTKAVKEDGSNISWKDAMLRSVCRLIPFEPFSAFSSNGMWHDRLAKTMVVKVR